MTQEDYLCSDLDPLLSKDNITEDDLLLLAEQPSEEQRQSPTKTPLTHELENLSITPTDKHIIALNDRPIKRKLRAPSRQLFRKQKKNVEATSNYSFTKNPQFQFHLNYKIKENIKQRRIVFWDHKGQEFTLENPSLNFQRISVTLKSISAIR